MAGTVGSVDLPEGDGADFEPIVLCDDVGSFLRQYTREADGSITFVDTEFDGVTLYSPSGLIKVCAVSEEESPGEPPCARQIIERCGCDDVNGDGTLIERYTEIWSVDPCDPTSLPLLVGTWLQGDFEQPYAPVNPVDCPGVESPGELEDCSTTVTNLKLCDLDPTATPDENGNICPTSFLRWFAHDCEGVLVNTWDTTLDGVTTYDPVGTVSDCSATGSGLVTLPWQVINIQDDPGGVVGEDYIFTVALIDGSLPQGTVSVHASTNDSASPSCQGPLSWGPGTTFTMTLDAAAQEMDYLRLQLSDFDITENIVATPVPTRAGGNAFIDGGTIRSNAENMSGWVDFEAPPAVITWTFDDPSRPGACIRLNFSGASRVDGCCGDCGSGGGTGTGAGTGSSSGCCEPCANGGSSNGVAPVQSHPGPSNGFGGGLSGGAQPRSLPAFTAPEPTASSACTTCGNGPDETTAGQANSGLVGEMEVTDTAINPYKGVSHPPLAGGGQALWDGGTLVFPAEADGSAGDGNQVYRAIAAVLQAERPACDNGTVEVSVSVQVTNDGPGEGAKYEGGIDLFVGDTIVKSDRVLYFAPVGHQQTLTVSAVVPAADFAAGRVTTQLFLETFHVTGKSWTTDQFEASYAYNVDGCGNGQSAMSVSICGPISVKYDPPAQGNTPPVASTTVIERCRCDDVDGDGIGEIQYTELWSVGSTVGSVPTLIGSYTSDLESTYEPVNPVECTPDGADEIVGTQARRVVLTAGQSWNAPAFPLLKAASVLVRTGTASVTDAAGSTNMVTGETASWDSDPAFLLTGPLTVTANAASEVVVNFTVGVTA